MRDILPCFNHYLTVMKTITKFSNVIGYYLPEINTKRTVSASYPSVCVSNFNLVLINCSQFSSSSACSHSWLAIEIPPRGRSILLISRMITNWIGLHSVLFTLITPLCFPSGKSLIFQRDAFSYNYLGDSLFLGNHHDLCLFYFCCYHFHYQIRMLHKVKIDFTA